MKIDDIPPFSRGYASELLRRADAELFGGHKRPTKIESAAGKLAATLGTRTPTEMPKQALAAPIAGKSKNAGRSPARSIKADARQMKFRF